MSIAAKDWPDSAQQKQLAGGTDACSVLKAVDKTSFAPCYSCGHEIDIVDANNRGDIRV